MAQGREYELKFALPPDADERLVAHPLLRPALPGRVTERLTSTYFDTPDASLRERSISLRVRRSASATVETVKSAAGSRVERAEWEHEGGLQPDIAWLRTTPLGPIFTGELPGALAPRFSVDVTRTALPLRFRGATIEAALDRGDIRAGDRSLLVSEFELELKRGTPGRVLDLARRLARDLPLTLSLASKAERGYAVADDSWGQPSKELQPDLSDAATFKAAFAAVTETCLHRLALNAALIVGGDGDRVEAVHRTRIALRHLRAFLALCRPALRRRRLKTLVAEVRWMSGLLGAARDADVMSLAVAADGGAREAAARIAGDRRAAHADLDGALASPRWRLLLIDLVAFAADGVRRRHRDRSAAAFLRRRLGKTRRRLARRTRGWSRHSPERGHDIRKRAKMLRYDIDLLGRLPHLGIKRRRLDRLGELLQLMQHHLGEVHDRAVLRGRIGGSISHATADKHDLRAAHRAARRLRRSRMT